MLSNTSKKIIQSRLYDAGTKINITDLDNYIIDLNKFNSMNEVYDFIVNNYNKLIIE